VTRQWLVHRAETRELHVVTYKLKQHTLKHEAHVNNINKFSSYGEENTTYLHDNDQLLYAVLRFIRNP
jgi:hypothetical protein